MLLVQIRKAAEAPCVSKGGGVPRDRGARVAMGESGGSPGCNIWAFFVDLPWYVQYIQ
jgi:hypothetical protein